MRMMAMAPVGSLIATVIVLSLASSGCKSGEGCSSQSISPVCKAEAAVEVSGIVIHSTRSKFAIFGPEVHCGVPFSRGL